jgi:hypothetical protein
MTEEEVNTMANELVEELIVFNKIKMNVKNIWATKLIDFFLSEKQDYNLYQHSKVMKKIPKVPADGIQALLELIKQQNNHNTQKLKSTTPEYGINQTRRPRSASMTPLIQKTYHQQPNGFQGSISEI